MKWHGFLIQMFDPVFLIFFAEKTDHLMQLAQLNLFDNPKNLASCLHMHFQVKIRVNYTAADRTAARSIKILRTQIW